ncbi:helix-turn-helix domain-containing protein [Halodesulfovibrio sp.]|jgi:hypothetical protein|uniref:helix-turn-helix domain-containing protein n=1 Tax=Halodesulfovibrio sp. TaxID=1912772 RepID=UPI0025E4EFAB|nr:helix-turn-helix domain-containing protein [Halodesulfovibrio sp.]MCT4625638.1 helix-turn-helix domain-containing protein [Halodesulfovibrio sp.]
MPEPMIEPAPRGAQHYPIKVIETDKMLLTTKEVSELTGIPVGTLTVWRCHKRGPRYVKFPKGVFYRPETLKKYFESCEVRTIDM